MVLILVVKGKGFKEWLCSVCGWRGLGDRRIECPDCQLETQLNYAEKHGLPERHKK